MKTYTKDELNEILRLHKLWLNEEGGERANLRYADLRSTDLSYADLRSADLRYADLRYADLSSADLRYADLRYADLSYADLSYADLSQSMNLLNAAAWLVENFKTNSEGYIVYKCFGKQYTPPANWKIEPDAYIEETVNQLPTLDCACGINFATQKWIESEYTNPVIWECLIEWKDACLITVPYNTNGKARCGRMKLIKQL